MDLVEDVDGGVEISAAIEALRAALVRSWVEGGNSRVRFKLEPVELTVQVGVTRTGKGSAGIKWHILSLGGERTKEAQNVQTLKLRLAPVLFDDEGAELSEEEQFISDAEAANAGEPPELSLREPQ